mmetsp:Transcript_23208/g.74307  ORF Transcript_23208/g.74307 Transcript_23208/m.74307 type:complete len:99 (+) Transcript_23208:885-1181(+)
MNDLLDSLAPRGSRRRDRIDGAVRQELQSGADPIDILEALEHELAQRVHKKLGTEPPPPPKKAAPPSLSLAPSLAPSLAQPWSASPSLGVGFGQTSLG